MSKYSLADKISAYQKQTKDRGYTFFSDQALQLHAAQYANHEKDMGVIGEKAKTAADAFLDKARDYKADGHDKARARYQNEFGGDEDAVHKHYQAMLLEANGISNMPIRKSAYEKGVLKPKTKAPTIDDTFTHKAFCDLMNAKWDAVGYEGDQDVIDEFEENYLPKQESEEKGKDEQKGSIISETMARLKGQA